MAEVKKLTKEQESKFRADFYEKALQGFSNYETEPVIKGRLIKFENEGQEYFATLNITLHNPEKFILEDIRNEYVTKLEAAAQRSAEKAEKDRIKAEKAAVKAAKK